MSNDKDRKHSTPSQTDLDNRSRQLNPKDDAYWQSRGQEKPSDAEAGRPPGRKD